MNLINIENYNIKEYKTEIIKFYETLKTLLEETNNLNKSIPFLENYIIEYNLDITNENDLKANKLIMDIINNKFKQAELINADIKKTLNNWKSTFAGVKGLDTHLKNLKEELLLPVKQKQIDYHNSILDLGTVKEKATTKTTIGLREYTKYRILSIDADILPREYWEINEQSVLQGLRAGKEIPGVKYEIIKELK